MGWFQKLIYGVDLEDEQRRQNELDAQLAAQNRQDLDSGFWSQTVYEEAEANRQSSLVDVAGQVDAEFHAGWNEGAAAIRGSAGDTISAAVGSALRVVPWQIWILGGIWLFVTFGGPAWLARFSKR